MAGRIIGAFVDAAISGGKKAMKADVDKVVAKRLNATKATEWIEAGVADTPIPPSSWMRQ